MFKPRTRHLILLFAAGFTWGYVAKTLIGKHYYIGWDDPQVFSAYPVIDFDELKPKQIESLKDFSQ